MRRLVAGLPLVGILGYGLFAAAPVASSVLQAINLGPGDTLTINCNTTLAWSAAGQQQTTYTCLPAAPSGQSGQSGKSGQSAQSSRSVQAVQSTGQSGGGGPRSSPPAGAVGPDQLQGGGGGGGTVLSFPPVSSASQAPVQIAPAAAVASDVVSSSPPGDSSQMAASPADATLGDTATLDAGASAAIASPGGEVGVWIPGGAVDGSVSISITMLSAPDIAVAEDQDLALGSRIFQLSAVDGSGSPVSVFDVPLVVYVQPSEGDFFGVGGDSGRFALALEDAPDGLWLASPTTVNTDGTISSQVDRPGVYALTWTSVAPDEPVDLPPDEEGSSSE